MFSSILSVWVVCILLKNKKNSRKRKYVTKIKNLTFLSPTPHWYFIHYPVIFSFLAKNLDPSPNSANFGKANPSLYDWQRGGSMAYSTYLISYSNFKKTLPCKMNIGLGIVEKMGVCQDMRGLSSHSMKCFGFGA